MKVELDLDPLTLDFITGQVLVEHYNAMMATAPYLDVDEGRLDEMIKAFELVGDYFGINFEEETIN